MNPIQDLCPFRPGLHRLRVVITDLAESEALIQQLAQDARAAHPEAFAGKAPCVYFKMPYVPPYETFRELRRLILRIRENTGLRAHFRGIVAIEVTEWLGHESEEYFTVLLKYLYDHRELWQEALVLNSGTAVQHQHFARACAGYITPQVFDAGLFSRPDRLRAVIRREFARLERTITRDAAEILTTALADPNLRHARSQTLIRRTAEELSAGSGRESIGADAVRDYLTDPESMLAMLAGKPLCDERSRADGTEMLQL